MSIYSVSALTEIVRQTLNSKLPFVWVHGEISNFSRSQTGHVYFTLKDERAQLDCVWFSSRQPKGPRQFDPLTGEIFDEATPCICDTLCNGMEIQCAGAIDVYANRGRYQLIVELAQLSGAGQLALKFEELKNRLAAAGYFSQARKRILPLNPSKIALITSAHGAAIHDFMELARERGLGSTIRLIPVPVQGDGAAEKIVAAIDFVNAQSWAEIIVIIRGGGSLEDLWTFNEENLAKAIHDSRLPILAGIGHEIDFTLADLTADLRAATPSHAAQLLWTPRNELWQRLDNLDLSLSKAIASRMDRYNRAWQSLASAIRLLSPGQQLRISREKLEWLRQKANASIHQIIHFNRLNMQALSTARQKSMSQDFARRVSKLDYVSAILKNLDPSAPLQRGYALLMKDDHVISSIKQISAGHSLRALLSDGELEISVEAIRQAESEPDFYNRNT